MFNTFPHAEFPAIAMPNPLGERSWKWVEMGLQIPYFLVSLREQINGCEIDRDILLSRLDDVLALVTNQVSCRQFVSLSILSPGYMNGTDHYQLGVVKTIWRSRSKKLSQLFILEDETSMNFDPNGNIHDSQDMELVLEMDSINRSESS